MILNNVIILLSCISLQLGETKWFTLPLADSYEYQILGGEGVKDWREYRNYFKEKGYQVSHFEVQNTLATFNSLCELRQWVQKEVAPQLGKEEDPLFLDSYLYALEKNGWIDLGDGKIRFPRKQLLVRLTSPNSED